MTKEKQQFWIILTIVFLGFVGISIPYLIFPPLFLNPDYPLLPIHWSASNRAFFLGIALAVYPFGQFIGAPLLGSLSDQYGRKHLLTGSLFVNALSTVFTAIAIAKQQLGLLIISRFISGVMEGNISIARAMAIDLKSLSKNVTLGHISAVTSCAYLIGPFFGGILASFSISIPFYCMSGFFIILTSLSAFVLKQSRAPLASCKSFSQQVNFIKKIRVLLANKQLKFLILASTFFTLAVDMFYEFGPVYLTLKWRLVPSQLIFYNAALCIGLAIGHSFLPSFLADKISIRSSILYSIGIFTLFLIGIILTESTVVMMTLCGLIGLVIGLAVTALTVIISDTASEQIQGEVMGTQQALRVLCDALICLCGGILLIFSVKMILIIAAILSLSTLVYYSRSRIEGQTISTKEGS